MLMHSHKRNAASESSPCFFHGSAIPCGSQAFASEINALDSEAETISDKLGFPFLCPPRALPIPLHRHIRLTAVGAFS